MVVVVKWSKTMQGRAKVTTLSVLVLGQSHLCPWKALMVMFTFRSLDQDLPLFQVPLLAGAVSITDSVSISKIFLGFQKPFTFHDFRYGGATWAFSHGVLLQDIQAQGTWSSSYVWRYIQLPSSVASPWLPLVMPTFLHDYFILGAYRPSICPASSISDALL